MAQIGMTFDATKHDPAGISSQLSISDSKGWPVIISESEMKETKIKDGSGFLQLTLRVIEGPNTGEEGKYRINLFNKNGKAVEIAYKQLSAICHVTNIFQVTDSAQLHNIPFRAVVGLQKRGVDWKEGDADFTEVKGVLDINGNQPGKSGTAPATSAPPVAPPTPPVAPVQPQAPVANVAPAPQAWSAPQQTLAPEQVPPAPAAWQQNPAAGGAVAPAPWQQPK